MSDDCKEARSCGVPPRRSQQKSYAINFYNDITQDDAINSLINPELYEKKELQGFLYVKNTGSGNLTNIAFYLTGNLAEIMVINVTRKNVLEPDEIIHQFIIVNGDKNPRYDEYRGELIASSDELNKSFSMIFVIKRGSREESPLIRQSRSLFTEEVTALPEEDYSVASQPEDEEKIIIQKEPPYKVIASLLIIVIIVLIYFLARRSSKREISFREYISKIDKK